MHLDQIVPHIDLSNVRVGHDESVSGVARLMNEALSTSGFFMITGHGVPNFTIGEAIKQMKDFFSLPIEQKLEIRSVVNGSPRGYLPYGLETLSNTEGKRAPPDLKEGFGMGPINTNVKTTNAMVQNSFNPNVWPLNKEFRSAIEKFYRSMEELTVTLMRLFAFALNLEEDFFTRRFMSHNSTLRLIHYPPLTERPDFGQLRAGEHTDYGALTILLPENKPGGLQILGPSGLWEDVNVLPGSFVINIGDLMMRWSNDKWTSSRHRVINPPRAIGELSRRYSVAYFCNPNDDLLIECLPTCCSPNHPAKYAPVLAGRHRTIKIEKSKDY